MSWWIISSIALLLITGVVYYFSWRKMKQQKADFDKMYSAHRQVQQIFVLNKKIVKQPVRPGWKFPKVKTYQVVARVTLSQVMKGTSFSKTQVFTSMTDKKEFEKIQVNHKHRVEIAGNYIGKVLGGKKAS